MLCSSIHYSLYSCSCDLCRVCVSNLQAPDAKLEACHEATLDRSRVATYPQSPDLIRIRETETAAQPLVSRSSARRIGSRPSRPASYYSCTVRGRYTVYMYGCSLHV